MATPPAASALAKSDRSPTVVTTFSATTKSSFALASRLLAINEPVIEMLSAEFRTKVLIEAPLKSSPELILISPVPEVLRIRLLAVINSISPEPSSKPPPPLVTILTLLVALMMTLAAPPAEFTEAVAPMTTSDAVIVMVSVVCGALVPEATVTPG